MKIKEAVLSILVIVILTVVFSLTWSTDASALHHNVVELTTKNDFLRGQSELLESVLKFKNTESSVATQSTAIELNEKETPTAIPAVNAPRTVVSTTVKPGDVGAGSMPSMTAAVTLSRSMPTKEQADKAATFVPPTSPEALTPSVSYPRDGPKLHIVTYASHGGRDDRFCRAVESAYHHSIELTILGWGVKWTGLSQKLYAAYNYAKSIPPTDIIMFVDAFDVMFAGSPEYILEQFRASSKTILFAAECGCWPQIMENRGHDCFHAYPPSPTPYRYLNSGTWIGVAKESAAMLLDIINKAGSDFANANDQKLVSDMFIHKQHGIQLDYFSSIFQSMHMTDRPLAHCAPGDDVTTPARRPISFPHNSSMPISYYNAVTRSVPALYHFNGGGKTYHLKYESGMWYRQKQREKVRTSGNRASVFEGVANYRLRIIPTIANTLVDSEIQYLPLKDLCGSYVNSLITNPRSI